MSCNERICPIKVIQISSKYGNEVRINPNFIEIGKNNRGVCSRAHLIFDFNSSIQVSDIEKAVLYIPVIDSNIKIEGTLYGYNITDFDFLDDLRCPLIPVINPNSILFEKPYYKNTVTEVDLTDWVIEKFHNKRAGIVLTTNESEREIAIINGKLNSCDGLRLIIYLKRSINPCCKCVCTCECRCNGCHPNFKGYEKIVTVNSNKNEYLTDSIYIEELSMYTVYFKNFGTEKVELEIQNSTDGIFFTDTGGFAQIYPNKLEGTTAYLYSKYIRISLKSKYGNIQGKLTIQGRY